MQWSNDNVVKWERVPHYWPFVRGNPPVTGAFPRSISHDTFAIPTRYTRIISYLIIQRSSHGSWILCNIGRYNETTNEPNDWTHHCYFPNFYKECIQNIRFSCGSLEVHNGEDDIEYRYLTGLKWNYVTWQVVSIYILLRIVLWRPQGRRVKRLLQSKSVSDNTYHQKISSSIEYLSLVFRASDRLSATVLSIQSMWCFISAANVDLPLNMTWARDEPA